MSISFQTPWKWQGGLKTNLTTEEILRRNGPYDACGELTDFEKELRKQSDYWRKNERFIHK